jgi:hypothetical protein
VDYVGYPLSQYECACDGTKWNCFVAVQGGGTCALSSLDGDAPRD